MGPGWARWALILAPLVAGHDMLAEDVWQEPCAGVPGAPALALLAEEVLQLVLDLLATPCCC